MPDCTLPETGSGRDEFLKSPQMRAVVSKLEAAEGRVLREEPESQQATSELVSRTVEGED